MSDVFRSADYARAKEPPKACNGQHAWATDHKNGKPLGGWCCQICGERREDNPVRSHAELLRRFAR